jgi:hypothetical protein
VFDSSLCLFACLPQCKIQVSARADVVGLNPQRFRIMGNSVLELPHSVQSSSPIMVCLCIVRVDPHSLTKM